MVIHALAEQVVSRVEKARQEQQLSKVSVARAAGISVAKLRTRLAGKKPFSVSELDRISDYLGIQPFSGGN